MAAYGYITRKFIRYGEIITEHLAPLAITASKIANNSIDGSKAANATVYAATNTNPVLGTALIVPVAFADGTSTIDITMPYKVRVIAMTHVKTVANAAGANTIAVLNTANSITGAITVNVNDTVVTPLLSINDANHEIPAAGLLRVTSTKVGTDSACIVYVTVIRVA